MTDKQIIQSLLAEKIQKNGYTHKINDKLVVVQGILYEILFHRRFTRHAIRLSKKHNCGWTKLDDWCLVIKPV